VLPSRLKVLRQKVRKSSNSPDSQQSHIKAIWKQAFFQFLQNGSRPFICIFEPVFIIGVVWVNNPRHFRPSSLICNSRFSKNQSCKLALALINSIIPLTNQKVTGPRSRFFPDPCTLRARLFRAVPRISGLFGD
jgi:hypothetical protein